MTARLSNLLLEHRTNVGLSQAEMAARIGVSQAGYGKLESGASLPRNGTMKRIGDATKLEMAVLNAARTAQYEWNNSEPAAVKAESAQVTKENGGTTGSASLELLAKLSAALAGGRLQRHHVIALSAVVDAYLAGNG